MNTKRVFLAHLLSATVLGGLSITTAFAQISRTSR